MSKSRQPRPRGFNKLKSRQADYDACVPKAAPLTASGFVPKAGRTSSSAALAATRSNLFRPETTHCKPLQ
ncbi:hypothetical protein [Caudoviricetes sp.]|nr:hypothetical protein [Caudoviricetes sp.]